MLVPWERMVEKMTRFSGVVWQERITGLSADQEKRTWSDSGTAVNADGSSVGTVNKKVCIHVSVCCLCEY